MDSRWKKEEIMTTDKPFLVWDGAQGGNNFPGWTSLETAQASGAVAG